MKLEAVGKHVLVKRDPVETVSKGGIHLPQNTGARLGRGLVLSSGVDGVKPGQTVFFTYYAGNEIEHEGEKFVVLKDEEVLARAGA